MIRLKEARAKKGLNQADVADRLGVSVQAYSRYENGQRECSYSSLIALASLFNCSIDYLLGRTASETLSAAPAISRSEAELLRKYRQLDQEDCGKLNAFLDFLLSQASAPVQKERAAK